MALHNVLIFCVLAFLLLIVTNVQCRREHNIQLRPTREFKNLPLSTARAFGKRSVNMHMVNNILLEWLALESQMKNLQRSNALRRLQYEDDFMPE